MTTASKTYRAGWAVTRIVWVCFVLAGAPPVFLVRRRAVAPDIPERPYRW
ncbi:hypothetical protein [Nocardia aurantiaca]|uniref:Uncharacterized protein n=1 Tax=Nocardia aurantiaca TaxID=2675850 RepID=A0A6I3L7S6_9NOCA|nr:hypothetical protein [Nocardia aurantiaca]MTE15879.1 hypothetical protein [Nocardia aurantiaca]